MDKKLHFFINFNWDLTRERKILVQNLVTKLYNIGKLQQEIIFLDFFLKEKSTLNELNNFSLKEHRMILGHSMTRIT